MVGVFGHEEAEAHHHTGCDHAEQSEDPGVAFAGQEYGEDAEGACRADDHLPFVGDENCENQGAQGSENADQIGSILVHEALFGVFSRHS